MASAESLPGALASVIITHELERRTPRAVNLQAETKAFRELADLFASDPENFLKRLVEVTRELCDGDTVGISVEQVDEKSAKIFRWVAIAGELKHLIGGTTPRNFSPCGVCVDQNSVLLMDRLDRAYPYFKEAPLPFIEALLLPWHTSTGAVGTLWVVAHSDRKKFDREDMRLVSCLAAFAAGAIQLQQSLREKEWAVTSAQVVSELAHHINNPLQGAMFAIDLAKSTDSEQIRREMVKTADAQLARVATLSAEMLKKMPRV
jgi:hypothetical protein